MHESGATRRQVIALLAGLCLIALCAFAISTSGAQASAPTAQQANPAWPTWPYPTWTWPTWTWPTWPPYATHTPCPNCTPAPTHTHFPIPPTWTPRPPLPTHTPGSPQPTRTPFAFPTHTPGSPQPTRTHFVFPTFTPHPPFATFTPRPPFPTHTPGSPEPTRTHFVFPTFTPHPPFATHTPGTPPATRTPRPSPTPRPLVLVPFVQFGFANPGTTANYHKYLFNSFTQATNVNLSGSSFGGWTVSVHPTSLMAQPGISNTIGISVTVPVSPTLPWDVERTLAASGGSQPYTATAYIITIAAHHPFNDVAESDWSYAPVQYLAARGIASGYPDGTFRPNDLVTRAQFSKMLVTAMGWDIVTPASGQFSDVSADYWAYSYIETAAAHGAISGYSDGTFQPGAAVTRAQIAKMIGVARGWAMDMPDSPTYVDVSRSDWYFLYAEMMHTADVMQGYSDGTFRPYAPATRAQVAKILSLSLYSGPGQ